jgi:Ca2+-binding RTX toxin-like protein
MAKIYGTDAGEVIAENEGVTNQRDIIIAGEGADTIYGLGGDDVMKGGGGADTFYGGKGVDEVDYSDSDEGVFINLMTGEGRDGTAQGDIFFSVENVTGSSYNDHIHGNGSDNTLRGSGGDDVLLGFSGKDVLEGGEGEDSLYGGSFADVISGGNADDFLSGGEGADQVDGGDGYDWASYMLSAEGVLVSLMHDEAAQGEAEGDSLNNIEGLQGSGFDDHLFGDDNVNDIWGGQGSDTLKGYGGDDTLYADTEDDTLIGGYGTDYMDGGYGADTFVWTSVKETGVATNTADRLLDFSVAEGDRIALSGIDADVYAAGNQAFTFIGTAAFTLNLSTPENTDVVPGEIRYYHANGSTYIEMQTGQSADVEGLIRLSGILTPEASWFVL